MIGLLTHRLTAPIAAGVFFLLAAGGLLSTLYSMGREVASREAAAAARDDARASAEALGQCRANLKATTDGLNRQNASLRVAKESAEAREAATARALKAARAESAGLRGRIAARSKLTVPAGSNRCEAASRLIRDTLAEDRAQ